MRPTACQSLRHDTNAYTITLKINKWDLIKIKIFILLSWRCLLRVWKVKLQEKIFINHVSVRILISRIYRKHSKFKNKKTTQVKDRQTTWTDIFTKDVKSIKRFSTLLMTREMQIKIDILIWNAGGVQYRLIRMNKMKSSINKYWQGCKKLNHSYIASDNLKWYIMTQQLYSWALISGKWKFMLTYKLVHKYYSGSTRNSKKKCRQYKCSSTRECIHRLWQGHTVKYYAAVQGNKLLIHPQPGQLFRELCPVKKSQSPKVA